MTAATTAMDWTHLWDGTGLPRPPLPAPLAQALRPLDADGSAFATPGWPAPLDIAQAMRLWLGEPARERAWVGVAGHGLQSTAVRVFLCGPHSGLFVQRIWSRLPGQADTHLRRIQGTFGLLGQLLQAQQRLLAAGRWPAQQRLLLCDDDFGTTGWAWLPHGTATVPPLADDPLAYPRLIAGLTAIATDSVASGA